MRGESSDEANLPKWVGENTWPRVLPGAAKPPGGALGSAVIATVVGGVYLALLAVFRVPELRTAVGMIRRR